MDFQTRRQLDEHLLVHGEVLATVVTDSEGSNHDSTESMESLKLKLNDKWSKYQQKTEIGVGLYKPASSGKNRKWWRPKFWFGLRNRVRGTCF
jgi:hypothetical protein